MQLPPSTAPYASRVRYGRYVARRVRRARLETLAVDLDKANRSLLDTGRAYDDLSGPVQDALADRDAADDDLDTAAQEARANLAGRSVEAARTEPYTRIFHEGIGYYTAAPLDEEVSRYTELKKRLAEHLPANDQVRVATIQAIDVGTKAFQEAQTALSAARTEESLAHTRLARATEAWERQMEKTYGALVAEVGRGRANAFFPRSRGKKGKKEGEPVGPGAGGSNP